VVLVPTAALQHNGTQAFVYVAAGGAVSMRNVNELSTENELSAVSGVEAGTTVAVSSFDKLQDGSKVTIQNTPAPAGGASGVGAASAANAKSGTAS
jgi:multidrug efflux system membrane fusion protein